MISTTLVSFGVTLFGLFSIYRDVMVDNYQSLELTITLTSNGLYYSFFYSALIVSGHQLKRCHIKTLAIIRKWINLSIFDNLDSLGMFAEKIENSTIGIATPLFEFDMQLLGEVKLVIL